MPLQSRLTRNPTPPQAPQAGVDLNTSPRRRGLTKEDTQAPPRQDALDTQEDPPSAEPERVAVPAPSDPPAKEVKPAPVASGRKRGPKPRPALPEDAANSTDPAVLREVLRKLEGEAKALRSDFDAQMKTLRTQYAQVSAKLAENL